MKRLSDGVNERLEELGMLTEQAVDLSLIESGVTDVERDMVAQKLQAIRDGRSENPLTPVDQAGAEPDG